MAPAARKMTLRPAWCAFVALFLVSSAAPARAWWPEGHSILSAAAVKALPAETPTFFREGGGLIAHCAQDPDVAKNRDAPMVSDREAPEHYIDLELLRGRALPPTRSEFLKLCAEMKLEPKNVGMLPYAVAEWTQRLSIAFAEHRKWPNNAHIRTKCLVYAGFLAHYAEDLCMPLHVTVDHDGRARPDGTSPHTGIHAKVDSLIEKLAMQPDILAKNRNVQPLDTLLPGILKEVEQSRAQVARVYALESLLPPDAEKEPEKAASWKATPELIAFADERARAATGFTAALFLTAWRDSTRIKLPTWLKREPSPTSTVVR